MSWVKPEEFLATAVPLDAVDWLEAGEDTAEQDLPSLQAVLGHRQLGDLHWLVVPGHSGGQGESQQQ